MEELNKFWRYQESAQRCKWVSGDPSDIHVSKAFSVNFDILDSPGAQSEHRHELAFCFHQRQGYENLVPLPREKGCETGCACQFCRWPERSVGVTVEGPPVCPHLLIEEHSANKICLILSWDHSMIWNHGQVAPLSFSHRLPGTIEAQQLKVFLLQIFSPCFRVLSWEEGRSVSHSWQLWSRCPPQGDVTNHQCLGESQRHRKIKLQK